MLDKSNAEIELLEVEVASNLDYLAFLYQEQGKLVQAEPLYVEALAIHRRLFTGRHHNDLAASINNLALLYKTQGKLEQAAPLYVEALAMSRRLFTGRDHNNLAISINNLAQLYQAQGKLDRAEPLYVEALTMRRQLFGCDHNSLAASINNLALLYKTQGKLAQAEPLYAEALAMCRRLFTGRDHNDLATSINNLAGLYESQGKLDLAEPLYAEALAMRRRLFVDRDHNDLATSINNLALLYQAQGKLDLAEPLYAEALAICRRLFTERDHNNLATSINNLALLYQAQGKLEQAIPLCLEALAMYRRLFTARDHNNLAASINNLAALHIAQQEVEAAFPLLLEAVEVEDNILRQWFGYSNEESRLGYVEGMQSGLEGLVSFLCTYFDDTEKIAQVAIAVARRKAFAAQAEVELNYLRYSDRYPHLAADFESLATLRSELTTLNHTFYHHQGTMAVEERETYFQVKQSLTERVEKLERKISASVPELRQLQQQITLPAIVSNLPPHSHTIEFYRFDVYDFAAPKGEKWKSPQYVAFIFSSGTSDTPLMREFADLRGDLVRLVKLGDAEEIDELINNYRALAQDANLPSFGARPKSEPQANNPTGKEPATAIDVRLSQRLVAPILDALVSASLNQRSTEIEKPQLIFIPDGDLHTLPIGNLPIDLKAPLFQLPHTHIRPLTPNSGGTRVESPPELGDLGGKTTNLSDYFTCTYLSTLRELLPRQDRPNQKPNPSLAITNPNYDYPLPLSPELATTGGNLSMRSLMSQLGATFSPIPESELLLDRLRNQLADNVQIFTQDRATETVLKQARSPQSLVIITHGYRLDRQRDRIGLIFALIQCPEGEEINLIHSHQHLLDRDFLHLLNAIADWLDSQSLNGANFYRDLELRLRENFPEILDRVTEQAIDPLQQHGLALTGANSWLAGETLPAEIGKGFLLARDVAYLDLWETELAIVIACSSGLGDVRNSEGVFGLRRAFAIAGVKQLITSLWDVPTRPTMLLTDKFFEAYHQGVTPAIALQSAQQYLRNVSREELAAMPLGKEILDELQGYSVKIPDPDYPLRHPFFWGAWICQGV